MSQQERLSKILSKLDECGQLLVPDICRAFGVSKDTARRDIVKLEQMGAVERFHGGIRQPMLKPQLEAYMVRLVMNPDIKDRLGRAAAKLVRDNDTVMLDLSVTVQFVAEHINANNVLAVTNSIDTAITLMNTDVARIYLTGGYLYPKKHALLGMSVLDKVKDFHYNIAFIGASAITPDGVYYLLEDDVILKRSIMQVADKVVLVADHTKYTEIAPNRMNFWGIDMLITDEPPSERLARVLRENNIETMVIED